MRALRIQMMNDPIGQGAVETSELGLRSTSDFKHVKRTARPKSPLGRLDVVGIDVHSDVVNVVWNIVECVSRTATDIEQPLTRFQPQFVAHKPIPSFSGDETPESTIDGSGREQRFWIHGNARPAGSGYNGAPILNLRATM